MRRPGDVVRLPRLGDAHPAPGSDLVAVFLGACRLDEEPDVPAFLRRLGWTRSHVFEVSYGIRHGPADVSRWTEVFSAATPRDAAESAVRLCQAHAAEEPGSVLEHAEVRLLRVGPVTAAGGSGNVPGKVFVRWSRDTGAPFDSVLRSEPAPPAGG